MCPLPASSGPSSRGSGAPGHCRLPPVHPGVPGQWSHRSSSPRAVLVRVMYRLCWSHSHCGRRFLPAAGFALQPLAEVFPTQGQWQLEMGKTVLAAEDSRSRGSAKCFPDWFLQSSTSLLTLEELISISLNHCSCSPAFAPYSHFLYQKVPCYLNKNENFCPTLVITYRTNPRD